MTITEFWDKVDKAVRLHRDRQLATHLTTEGQHENITDFLVEMDGLASGWYNREEGET